MEIDDNQIDDLLYRLAKRFSTLGDCLSDLQAERNGIGFDFLRLYRNSPEHIRKKHSLNFEIIDDFLWHDFEEE